MIYLVELLNLWFKQKLMASNQPSQWIYPLTCLDKYQLSNLANQWCQLQLMHHTKQDSSKANLLLCSRCLKHMVLSLEDFNHLRCNNNLWLITIKLSTILVRLYKITLKTKSANLKILWSNNSRDSKISLKGYKVKPLKQLMKKILLIKSWKS